MSPLVGGCQSFNVVGMRDFCKPNTRDFRHAALNVAKRVPEGAGAGPDSPGRRNCDH